VKLLLDTCTLLWFADERDSEQRRLSIAAHEALIASHNELHVSAISAFEIARKVSIGKLALPLPPDAWFWRVLERYQVREVPVTSAIALHAPTLGLTQKDPADRIVVSTAILLGMTVITADKRILDFPGVHSIW
jgi:PIN domain nuclease of toxin-antitoxin system